MWKFEKVLKTVLIGPCIVNSKRTAYRSNIRSHSKLMLCYPKYALLRTLGLEGGNMLVTKLSRLWLYKMLLYYQVLCR